MTEEVDPLDPAYAREIQGHATEGLELLEKYGERSGSVESYAERKRKMSTEGVSNPYDRLESLLENPVDLEEIPGDLFDSGIPWGEGEEVSAVDFYSTLLMKSPQSEFRNVHPEAVMKKVVSLSHYVDHVLGEDDETGVDPLDETDAESYNRMLESAIYIEGLSGEFLGFI